MILLSTLGTGKYETTVYHFEGEPERVCETRFAQVAVGVLCQVARSVILATDDAAAKNGEAVLEECRTRGIEAELVRIATARRERELWDVLDAVERAVAEPVELVLDVTHAFRHLPLILVATAGYLTVQRGVTVQRITYGAFEAKTGDNRTPVFDLTPLLRLNDAYHAIREVRESGSTKSLARILREVNRRAYGAGAGDAHFANVARAVGELGEHFANGLCIEAGLAARRARTSLRTATSEVRDPVADRLLPLVKPILDDLSLDADPGDSKSAVPLTPAELDRQLRVVERFLDAQATSRALRLLREWIVSRCLLAAGATSHWLDYNKARQPMERAIQAVAERARLGDSGGLTPAQRDLAALWQRIAERRNAFAHAGMTAEWVHAGKALDVARSALKCCRTRLDDDRHWQVDVLEGGCRLLVTPLGLSPGIIYSALSGLEPTPERLLVLSSAEAVTALPEACHRAGFDPAAATTLIVNDAHDCFREADRVVAQAEPWLARASDVTVNVTGGTTGLQYLCERVATRASRLGVPVRHVALVDRRPPEEQRQNPFVKGVVVDLGWQ